MSMKEWLKEANPIPYDETEEYKRFNDVFGWIEVSIMIFSPYILLLIYGENIEQITSYIRDNFSLFQDRVEFLKTYDNYSAISYSATILTSLLFMPIMLTIRVVGYWKTVVAKRRCKGLNSKTPFFLLCFTTLFLWVAEIAFLEVPQNFDPRWPGNTRWFFWPLYPLVGGGAALFINANISLFLVVILKLVFLRRGHYE
ncbi:hypothetical protein [uncultured Cohaesibacter sp.]|uniref:hypothetical protein n=1 Tax=uncultured Cohaesibacter sp. TaxID=1002546 RepID=UPI002AABF65F|nr:hypothetical protein [uncultured Cohaesibacter sp.]